MKTNKREDKNAKKTNESNKKFKSVCVETVQVLEETNKKLEKNYVGYNACLALFLEE